jgi:hypothetical protein
VKQNLWFEAELSPTLAAAVRAASRSYGRSIPVRHRNHS